MLPFITKKKSTGDIVGPYLMIVTFPVLLQGELCFQVLKSTHHSVTKSHCSTVSTLCTSYRGVEASREKWINILKASTCVASTFQWSLCNLLSFFSTLGKSQKFQKAIFEQNGRWQTYTISPFTKESLKECD